MARKSDIRQQCREGLVALAEAMRASDEEQAEKHLATALGRFQEAAGIAQPAGGRLRERTVRERDFTTTERVALAKRGRAIPVRNDRGEIVDGRYPVETSEDVVNAVRDFNRSGGGTEEKQHIIKAANRTGAMGALPPDWKGSKGKKASTRESAPLTLREAVSIGEATLVEAMFSDSVPDERLGLLERMGLDR